MDFTAKFSSHWYPKLVRSGWSEADPIYNITEGPDPRIGVSTAVTFFFWGKTYGNWEIMGLLGILGNLVI